MGDVADCLAIVKRPVLLAILVRLFNREHRDMIFAIGDQIFTRRNGKFWCFHDQAIFIKPPIVNVKAPPCGRDIAGFAQDFIQMKPNADWAGINALKPPGFRACA